MTRESGSTLKTNANSNSKHTTVRYRGKRFDQITATQGSLTKSIEEERKLNERKKMIQRSNERLRMLDQMGKAR